eukprot:TRINITY_DN7316_c0_g1_i1.p1 TRINITY_DN7316_c0_g1~~TRINITY_DN7316_c0_g1_i1.p1  ORF type:complete len:143 (+),score=48.90 TRINITY_DN7316_c0_g1_i1:158-586(+)
MIIFFLLQNRAGKTRLSKWYKPYDEDERRKIENEVHRLVTSRENKLCNFVEWRTFKIIYRRYAGLFFTICCDVNDNELSCLEAIHFFVELLDQYFGNVCELDLVFNFHKVLAVVDEFILAGELMEVSKQVIINRLMEVDALD